MAPPRTRNATLPSTIVREAQWQVGRRAWLPSMSNDKDFPLEMVSEGEHKEDTFWSAQSQRMT